MARVQREYKYPKFNKLPFNVDQDALSDNKGYYTYELGTEALLELKGYIIEPLLLQLMCRDMGFNTLMIKDIPQWRKDMRKEIQTTSSCISNGIKRLTEKGFITRSECKGYIRINHLLFFKGKAEVRKQLIEQQQSTSSYSL